MRHDPIDASWLYDLDTTRIMISDIESGMRLSGDVELSASSSMMESSTTELNTTTTAIVVDLTTIDDVISISWPVFSLLLIYLLIQHAVEISLIIGNIFLVKNLQTLSVVWKDHNRSGAMLALLSLTYAGSLLIFIWNQTDLGPVLARLCLLPSTLVISPMKSLLIILFIDVMSRLELESIDLLIRTWTRSPSTRARIMSIMAGFSDLHRELVPARIWLDFLQDGAGSGPGLGLILRLAYLYTKSTTLIGSLSNLYRACKLMTSRSPVYGEYVADHGDHLCPICQEMARGPVQLPCSHVFCEQCLCTWSEHQRSCPMCRSGLSSRLDLQYNRSNGYYRFGPIRLF